MAELKPCDICRYMTTDNDSDVRITTWNCEAKSITAYEVTSAARHLGCLSSCRQSR